MRITLFALAAVVMGGAAPAEAKCGCGGWLLTEQVAEGKPYIVLEASCGPRPRAVKIELVDPSGKPVPTTVVTTHDGYSGSVQHVFSPDRPLAPGKHQVIVDGDKLDLAVLAVPANAAPPSWRGPARVVDQDQIEYGCGPAKTVEVQAGPDSSLAFVELVDAAKHRMSGYVKVEKGNVQIGHGMCSGAFPLVRGRSYTATITLLAPERATSSTSKTVTFSYAP